MFLMAAYKVAGFVEIATHMLGSLVYCCGQTCVIVGALWIFIEWMKLIQGEMCSMEEVSLISRFQCIFFLKVKKVFVAQLCPILCDPINCSPPGSSVHGILQARILEWVAIPFSRGSFRPRDQTLVSHIAGRFFTIWATREVPRVLIACKKTWKSLKSDTTK